MTQNEILAAYPIADLFDMLTAFITANALEDNVSETKVSLLALVSSAKDVAVIPNTPKYNVFLSVFEYVRPRVDGNVCQNYPTMCGFYKNRGAVMQAFDFTVFD